MGKISNKNQENSFLSIQYLTKPQSRFWIRFFLFACAASPDILFPSASTAASGNYAIIGNGYSSSYTGNCTVSYCAISGFVPSGNGNCPICGEPPYWDSTTPPNGHYYWFGSVRVLQCTDGRWTVLTNTPSWFFNYDPREGDQSAIVGSACDGPPPEECTVNDPECHPKNFGPPDQPCR